VNRVGMGSRSGVATRAQIAAAAALSLGAHAFNIWHIERWRGVRRSNWNLPEGDSHAYDYSRANLIWVDEFKNIVVTAGKNKLLDATLKTGLASPAWYVGLKATGTVAVGDTMGSHAGWGELAAATPTYSNATRPAFTPGSVSAGSVDNSASKAVFNINATITVFGAFLADSSTIDGTSGTLYGAGDFASSRALLSGDTLNVTITPSIS
jgi:hypothetical protein